MVFKIHFQSLNIFQVDSSSKNLDIPLLQLSKLDKEREKRGHDNSASMSEAAEGRKSNLFSMSTVDRTRRKGLTLRQKNSGLATRKAFLSIQSVRH